MMVMAAPVTRVMPVHVMTDDRAADAADDRAHGTGDHRAAHRAGAPPAG